MATKTTEMSVNFYFVSQFVAHTADLQRVAESERRIVVGMLKALEKELMDKVAGAADGSRTKKRLEALLVQARAQIASTYEDIGVSQEKALKSVGDVEILFFNNAFQTALGAAFPAVALSESQLVNAARNTLINGAPSAAWWKSQSRVLQDRFAQEMRMGYLQGENLDLLTARVRGRFSGRTSKVVDPATGAVRSVPEYTGGITSISRRHAESLVRTSIQTMAASVRMDLIQENADVMKGMMWHATLDHRTTPLCRARDGKMYTLDGKPIGHDQPFLGGPPAHWNCRSTLVPVTKSWGELGGNAKIDAIYDDFVKGGKRASMDGAVPSQMTYGEWFKSIPEDRQKDILGPRKWRIWKDKGLSFTDMVDQKGNPLTINELRQRYSA